MWTYAEVIVWQTCDWGRLFVSVSVFKMCVAPMCAFGQFWSWFLLGLPVLWKDTKIIWAQNPNYLGKILNNASNKACSSLFIPGHTNQIVPLKE